MPTIALSTFSLGPDCTALQGIEFAVKHGFRGLELGSWKLWPESVSKPDARAVRAMAASNGIDLSVHFIHRGVAPASHDAERRKKHLGELEASLNLAYEIGARPIVIHPGPIDYPGVEPAEASEKMRQEAIQNLAELLVHGSTMAEDTGTVLCVENLFHVPGLVIQSYDELVRLVESVNSQWVQITLDTGHAARSDGLSSAFETFAPYLRHIHIHDSEGQSDHQEIGRAGIDFSRYRHYLERYPFTLAMESRDEDDPEGCVLRSRDRLKELLDNSAR